MKMFEITEDKTQKNVLDDNFYDASKYLNYDKFNFVIYQYEEQEKSTKERLNSKRDGMYLSIFIFLVASVPELFFLYLGSEFSIFYPGAFGVWIAFIIVGIVFVKSIFRMIENIFEFHVNNETSAFMSYKVKKGIFTIKAEQRYCREQISNLKNAIKELQAGLNTEVLNQYKEVKYIERRADQKAFTFFEDHKIISNIMIIIFVIFLLMI